VTVALESAPLAALRVMRAPDPDPPEVVPHRAPPGSGEQTMLPLLFVLPTGLGAAPAGTPDADAVFDRQPSSTHELPDPRTWVARLSRAAVEVQLGARRVAQLRRWLSDEVYDDLARATRRRSGRVAEPYRRPAARPPRVVLRTVRTCEVADGVVEGCAVVDDGTRAWAIVLRLEGADGRWRCTALRRVTAGEQAS
jgi:hypothetical protein